MLCFDSHILVVDTLIDSLIKATFVGNKHTCTHYTKGRSIITEIWLYIYIKGEYVYCCRGVYIIVPSSEGITPTAGIPEERIHISSG